MSLSFTHNNINISFGTFGVHQARPSTVSFRFHFPAYCEFFSLDQLSFPSINSTLWRGEERRARAPPGDTQHPPTTPRAGRRPRHADIEDSFTRIHLGKLNVFWCYVFSKYFHYIIIFISPRLHEFHAGSQKASQEAIFTRPLRVKCSALVSQLATHVLRCADFL